MNGKLFVVFAIVSLAFTVAQTSKSDDDRTVNKRYRRGFTRSKCHDLVANNSYCVKSVDWNLKTMFMNANCSGSIQNTTSRGDCIQREVCQSTCPLENIDEKTTCSKVSESFLTFLICFSMLAFRLFFCVMDKSSA